MTANHEKASLSGIELLQGQHHLDDFHSGKAPLDDWLKRHALRNQAGDATRSYVVHRELRVVAYYSLAAGSVSRDEVPPRIARGMPRHPVPIILLARLAVDHREQGQGLGSALLKDALKRSAQVADTIAARAVLVHAIDEEARGFYRYFDFQASPVDPMTLMLLMKDLRALLRS